MPRLLFEKTGNAVWISHLDLMRLFQRAFKRAGLALTHTHGFNPRPSVSIALPLSVGVESVCELLDFELDGDRPEFDHIKERLNAALVDGVRVLEVYDTGRKLKELSLLSCAVRLEYDHGVPAGAVDAITELFQHDALLVEKKSKNGPVEQDIIPMIRKLTVEYVNEKELVILATVCCQNPSMNPMQIAGAVGKYLQAYTPDYSSCRRLEILDVNEKIFR